MPQKERVHTPVRFTVKEGSPETTPWIAIEELSENAPSFMHDALVNLHPPRGTPFKRVKEIAEFLNNNIEALYYQHPIEQ